MKKVFMILVMSTILAVPMSAMAMTPVSDKELADITGRTGVSIYIDVTINLHIGIIAWGDPDGFGGTTSGGWVGLKNLYVTGFHVGPRTDYLSDPSKWPYLQSLTIDVFHDPWH